MTVITKTSTTTTTYVVIKDHIAYEQALHIMTRVSFRVRFSRDFSQVTTPSNGEFAYGQKITALKFKVKLVKERNNKGTVPSVSITRRGVCTESIIYRKGLDEV